MLLGSVSVALSWMVNIRIEPKFDTIPARLLVAFLAFMQPLGRGWARYFTWLKFKRTPARVIATPEPGLTREAHTGSSKQIDFWNETGQGREVLLTETLRLLEDEGWRFSIDTGWKPWDILVYGNLWWSVKVGTVTEYHGGPKCLTRTRLGLMMVPTTFLVNAVLLSTLLYRQFFMKSAGLWRTNIWSADLWFWIFFLGFLLWLARRGNRLRRRVADVVVHAAQTIGLKKVTGRAAKPKAAS
jgi:hypothetical protein